MKTNLGKGEPAADKDSGPVVRVALNTWLVLRARATSPADRTFGGLPNDFLTHGAAALLIFDHVLCDEDGLSTEAAMPWVSSFIFSSLKAEGLLRPHPYRTEYSQEVYDRFEQSGLLPCARAVMHRQLQALDRGDARTENLQLPAILRWLNSVMFIGIDLPGTLHYDYHENHFGNLSLSFQAVLRELAPPLGEVALAEVQTGKSARLTKVLSLILPDFQLLPPISSPEAKTALQESIQAEKRMMHRYVYGGMHHADYEAFRTGSDFRRRDAIVDSADRFRQAETNLELLLKVRDVTKEMRRRAQSVISAVVNGRRTVESVHAELVTIRSTIDDALNREARLRDLRVLSGAEAFLGAVETCVALASGHPAGVLHAIKSFASAARERHEASELRTHLATLGRRFPLAWIAGSYRQERRRGGEAMNPRKPEGAGDVG